MLLVLGPEFEKPGVMVKGRLLWQTSLVQILAVSLIYFSVLSSVLPHL